MQLRAVTYNIHKGVGGVDRRYELERIRDAIAHHEPDLVLMQEVVRGSRRHGNHDQTERLGDWLGLRHRTWFSNVRRRRFGEYGNAILSRFPITDTENVDVTVGPKKARSVLHARLRVRIDGRGTRTLHVFNLHLGLSGIERKIQLRRFLASKPFAGLDHRTPVLVGGDFNDVWGSLGRFLAPHGFAGHEPAPRTWPAIGPVRALDSVYVRGRLALHRLHRSRLVLAREASDHLPLVAELEIT